METTDICEDDPTLTEEDLVAIGTMGEFRIRRPAGLDSHLEIHCPDSNKFIAAVDPTCPDRFARQKELDILDLNATLDSLVATTKIFETNLATLMSCRPEGP
jgi:hypothetical protein